MFLQKIKEAIFPTQECKEHYTYKAWEHVYWGDRISVVNWNKRRIVGWLDRIPNPGDRIQFQVNSGNVLETVVQSVERCSDPKDMFFATVKDHKILNSLDWLYQNSKPNDYK
jgi:hypothetical protein